MAGKIELIGIYQLPVTDELVAAQAEWWPCKDEKPSLAQCAEARELLEFTVLVEVLVSAVDANYKTDDFAQENPQPEANWQAAWAEAYLSADGQELLIERGKPFTFNYTTFRVAFFIHYWQHNRPIWHSYGTLPVSQPTLMPERLQKLVPYEFLD